MWHWILRRLSGKRTGIVYHCHLLFIITLSLFYYCFTASFLDIHYLSSFQIAVLCIFENEKLDFPALLSQKGLEGKGGGGLSLESRVKCPYIHESSNFLEQLLDTMDV